MMMMNRHRSTSRSRSRARESESRQPEEDGRTRRGIGSMIAGVGGNNNNNPPRTPRSNASSANNVVATPPPTTAGPTTPKSAPPGNGNAFSKTRCYRLNLEKPFDIRQQKSPLGRDYSGPPVHDSDLPPAQGPVEYYPPPHLCSREEMAWRRHSWGGANNSAMSSAGASTPSELLANLHVSMSEESNGNDPTVDPTTIAISTARIFRGIVVDRKGVITSMNSRAMRSQRGKNGGENKNKMGEKSRQAAKIDKAKDLIDDVDGGGGGMSDEENDPTKTVSLFIMGEYEDLNDLVRDGSKKLRDSKSLSDEAILMYNRPRQGLQPMQPMAISPSNNGDSNMVLSPNTSGAPYSPSNSQYSSSVQQQVPVSPTNTTGTSTSSSSNLRKRVFSSDKSRSRYKQAVPRSSGGSTPPKLKSNPRDVRSSSGRSATKVVGVSSPGPQASSTTSPRYSRGNSTVSHQVQQQAGGMLNCNPGAPKQQAQQQQPSSQQQQQHYFPQQCNFFPGNSDWTEALGFSVNSLWNCGANGGHMSPTMTPPAASSPRGSSSAHNGGGSGYASGGGSAHGGQHHHPPTSGGGVYHGSNAPANPSAGYGHHHHHASSGYQGGSSGYHHSQQQQHGGGYNNNGYYNNVEGRNPSSTQGYGNGGYRGNNAGVRDTVVM
ncbi:hypothetical protein ACHAXR_009117 [Thalassiosira sp. AJA248-18]